LGNRINYSGYVTAGATDTTWNLVSTGVSGSLTVIPTAAIPAAAALGAQYVVADTAKIPALGATVVQYLFVTKDATTHDLQVIQNIGSFYRAFGVSRADSLRWFQFVRPSYGLNNTWTAFDTSMTLSISPGVTSTVELLVQGKIVKTETITAGGTDYNCYRVEITQNVIVGSTAPQVTTAYVLDLAVGIGPVVLKVPATASTTGLYRIMTSKSF
jgi:hypothetical protein